MHALAVVEPLVDELEDVRHGLRRFVGIGLEFEGALLGLDDDDRWTRSGRSLRLRERNSSEGDNQRGNQELHDTPIRGQTFNSGHRSHRGYTGRQIF